MAEIKVYTRYNEYTNTRYSRHFSIVDELPLLGDDYHGTPIKRINEVSIDTEQGDPRTYDYNYYHIITTEVDCDNEETEIDYYIAVPIDYEEDEQ